MSNVSGLNGASFVNSIGETSLQGKSIQYVFAMVQLELAKSNKSKAEQKIQTIREAQEDSKSITEAINSLRNLKENFDSLSKTDRASRMEQIKSLKTPVGNLNICTSSKIDVSGDLSKDKLDMYISQMQSFQESNYGTDTQQLMIECQDFMGQYNTFLSGANSQIQKESEISSELARAR
ncbi:MAG: hypothetical protein ACI4NE_05835 [Succinivibrio sp.]